MSSKVAQVTKVVKMKIAVVAAIAFEVISTVVQRLARA